VLSSYSWSINIVGAKVWTMHPPGGNNQGQEENIITIRQGTHEALFVPSTWQHSVENAAETISINHNWANGAMVDLLCDTLCGEADLVKKELLAFGANPDAESSENMLRACAGGLNVSMLFIYLTAKGEALLSRAAESDGALPTSENFDRFDLCAIASALRKLLVHFKEGDDDMRSRLSFALKDDEGLADELLTLGNDLAESFS